MTTQTQTTSGPAGAASSGPGTVERIAQTERSPASITRTLVESDLYPVPGHPSYYYAETLGAQGLYKKGESKGRGPKVPPDVEAVAEDKRPVWTLVLPRIPVVTENYVELDDSGEVARQYFTLAAGRDSARAVNLADLRTGDAWTKLPDLVGTGSRTIRDLLVSLVSDQAERVPRMYAVARTGMHTIDGRRIYVYPDGRTYPPGPSVRVIGASAELAAAAAPLDRPATGAEIRAALGELPGHGWHVLFALGVGARSFGYSTRPVAGGAGVWGDPGSGKTLSAGVARKLILSSAYPPIATAAFSDTITDIECKVAVEADMPVLIDDLALTADSSNVEIDDGRRKLEMLFRAAGNAKAMRGRRRRDLTAAEERRLGSIPLVTAQQMPRTMQASLYRRTVLPRIGRGEIDSAWYLADTEPDGSVRVRAWDSLDRPLRTLGDRIVRRLVELGDQAGPWLDKLSADARALIGPALDKVLTEIPAELETVIAVACAAVAGLLMLADAAGVERAALVAPVLAPFADTVARQGDVITDRQDTADNLATAISDMVRAALLGKRAHVRDAAGVISPCVPGQTEQAQGVTKVPGSGEFGTKVEWNGSGVAFYFDQAADVLKVRSTELHSLCAMSPDPRVKGRSVQTLPSDLLRAAAILPSPQKESPAVVRERIPGQNGLLHMVHLRGSVIWRNGDADGGPELAAPAAVEPTAPAPVQSAPGGPVEVGPAAAVPPEQAALMHSAYLEEIGEAPDLAALESLGKEVVSDVPLFGLTPAQVADLRAAYSARVQQLRDAAAPAEVAPAAVPAQRAADTEGDGRPERRVTGRGKRGTQGAAPAADVAPRALDAVGIDLADGALTGYPAALPDGTKTLAQVMEWAAGLDLGAAKAGRTWFRHDGIVYVSADAAARLGLPKSAPKSGNRHEKALAAAGWTLGAAGITGYTTLYRGEKPERVSRRLVILPYLEVERPTAPEFTTMGADVDDGTPVAARLARRQNAFGALTDTPMAFSGAGTGMALLRERRPERLPRLTEDGKYERDSDNAMVMDQAPFSVEAGGAAMPLPILHQAHPDAARRTAEQTCREEDYAWIRRGEDGAVRLTGPETAAQWAVGLDTMTSFASVLERLVVPLGTYEHAPRGIDPTGKGVHGFGYADLSGIETEPDLPHFATASGERPTGAEWYAMGTLKYAATAYGWDGRATDAYLTSRYGALFEPWWPPLRDAYLSLMARAGVTAELTGAAFLDAHGRYKQTVDPDTLALIDMVKSLYKTVVGKFRQGPNGVTDEEIEHWIRRTVNSPWHRTDIRAYVLSSARTMAHYRYRKTYQANGRAPFAISHDRAVYASDSPSPLNLVPAGPDGGPLKGAVRLGVRPGSMKPEGVAPLAELLTRATQTGRNPADLVASYTDGVYTEKGINDGEMG